MQRRLKKLEAALDLDSGREVTTALDLDQLTPREVCESLHRVYGIPGTPVDYTLTNRDMMEAVEYVYGKVSAKVLDTATDQPDVSIQLNASTHRENAR